jgi:hypothetical protein
MHRVERGVEEWRKLKKVWQREGEREGQGEEEMKELA